MASCCLNVACQLSAQHRYCLLLLLLLLLPDSRAVQGQGATWRAAGVNKPHFICCCHLCSTPALLAASCCCCCCQIRGLSKAKAPHGELMFDCCLPFSSLTRCLLLLLLLLLLPDPRAVQGQGASWRAAGVMRPCA
jgi:hypothetical protein